MLGVGPAPEGGRRAGLPGERGQDPGDRAAGQQLLRQRRLVRDDPRRSRGRRRSWAGCEVDEHGNLANWAVPGKPLLGVGGAMDLASGAKRLIVTMTHTTAGGAPKIVPGVHACRSPRAAWWTW